jgi:hypothetical protein
MRNQSGISECERDPSACLNRPQSLVSDAPNPRSVPRSEVLEETERLRRGRESEPRHEPSIGIKQLIINPIEALLQLQEHLSRGSGLDFDSPFPTTMSTELGRNQS